MVATRECTAEEDLVINNTLVVKVTNFRVH